jgi:hypothetical protein
VLSHPDNPTRAHHGTSVISSLAQSHGKERIPQRRTQRLDRTAKSPAAEFPRREHGQTIPNADFFRGRDPLPKNSLFDCGMTLPDHFGPAHAVIFAGAKRPIATPTPRELRAHGRKLTWNKGER